MTTPEGKYLSSSAFLGRFYSKYLLQAYQPSIYNSTYDRPDTDAKFSLNFMYAFYKFAKASAFGGRGHIPPPAPTPYGQQNRPYIVTKNLPQ